MYMEQHILAMKKWTQLLLGRRYVTVLSLLIHIARKAEIIPHGAQSSGQGPKEGPVVISEGLPYNEYYYEFKEFADLIEQGKTESEINSLQTSLTVLEIIDEILVQ